MPDILLVAATERELAGSDGLVCGIGPVEAAVATARALALRPVAAVLHVGVARKSVPAARVAGSRQMTNATSPKTSAAMPTESGSVGRTSNR